MTDSKPSESSQPFERSRYPKHINAPDLCDSVLSQLKADLKDPVPCQYDVEFLSAYLDGALYIENADEYLVTVRTTSFEQHLPACSLCHGQLGLLSDTIHAYRLFGFTLEKQLASWCVADLVMTQFEDRKSQKPSWKVLIFSDAKKHRLSMAGMGIAAAMMLFLFSDGLFPTPGLNPVMLEASVPETYYQSPEAYLFSNQAEVLSQQRLQASQKDVTLAALEE